MVRLVIPLLVVVLLGGGPVAGADQAEQLPPGFDPQRHMRISEVREGMKGYGLSVFRGAEIERFDVEVISVLENFNVGYDVVLVRLSGANLEHTGPISGMSGSPIFLEDEEGRHRMIGAFAYGWALSKDPVGGVQPIEYMLSIPPPTAADRGEQLPLPPTTTQPGGRIRWMLEDAIPTPWSPQPPPGHPLAAVQQPAGPMDLSANPTRMRPLATPLMVSGVSPQIMAAFEPIFRSHNLLPVQAGAAGQRNGADDAAPLEPGSAMAVPLLTGDVNFTAIGTTTEVIDDRVLGFGHSFFSEGPVNLPMGSGHIHSVIANLAVSFKLGSATAMRGTLHSDETVGIVGRTGEVAQTVPFELRVVYDDGSIDRVFRFDASQHPRLTPLLAAISTAMSLNASRELPQYHTLEYDLELTFSNGQKLSISDRMVGATPMKLFQTIGAPVIAAAENPFERLMLSEFRGTVRVASQARESRVLSVTVPRSRYQPGETMRVFVMHRPFRGPETILPVEFPLPRDLPDGEYEFSVSDAFHHLMAEHSTRPFRFTAESADEVFAVLSDFTGIRSDHLYLRLVRQADGVAMGRTAMPHLPSSRRQVMLGSGRSNTTSFVSASVQSVPMEHVMSGQARFRITIDRESRVEQALQPGQIDPAPGEARPRPDLPGEPSEPAEPAESPTETEPAPVEL